MWIEIGVYCRCIEYMGPQWGRSKRFPFLGGALDDLDVAMAWVNWFCFMWVCLKMGSKPPMK